MTDDYPRTRWTDVERARDEALAAHPDRPAHFAIARLLELTAKVGQGRRDPLEAVEAAKTDAAQDPQNFVGRLAQAVIVDQRAIVGTGVGGGPTAPMPLDRFERMRAVVEAIPRARHATLYNAAFTAKWREVLQRYIRRPDMAVSLAVTIPAYPVTEHYTTLPLIQRWVTDLAAELRAEGRSEAADICIGWLGDLLLGLIDAEPDSGTRLLCADLLADALGRESAAAQSLVKLRDDLHASAVRAPIDKAD